MSLTRKLDRRIEEKHSPHVCFVTLFGSPRVLLKRLLLRRTLLSEWIVTRQWYRNGPLGLLLLVRDEVDIIRDNLEFHLTHGVDFIIVTDNHSRDGTRDILADYARRRNVVVLDEPSETYEQSKWVTRMVRLARNRFRARWVLPGDADEFWMPRDGNYRTDLARPANVFRAYWLNMLPVEGRPWTRFDRVGEFLAYNGRMSKLLCATYGFHEIYQGNHDVRLVPKIEADSVNVSVYHYPIRTYQQFETKVVNGGRAYQKNPVAAVTWGSHWRDWYTAYEEGRLAEVYASLGSAGEGRIDSTMEEYFRRCDGTATS